MLKSLQFSCENNLSPPDNVDTRGCMDHIRELVSAGNTYISTVRQAGGSPARQLLVKVATYVTDLLKVGDLFTRV